MVLPAVGRLHRDERGAEALEPLDRAGAIVRQRTADGTLNKIAGRLVDDVDELVRIGRDAAEPDMKDAAVGARGARVTRHSRAFEHERSASKLERSVGGGEPGEPAAHGDQIPFGVHLGILCSNSRPRHGAGLRCPDRSREWPPGRRRGQMLEFVREMITAATVYAKAHPRRGRLRKPSWRKVHTALGRAIRRRGA